MTVVERFIELQAWPTSRKVAFVAAYVAALCACNLAVGAIFLAPSGWVDMTFYYTVFVFALGHSALVAVVAWRVDSSRGGRWTFLALAVPWATVCIVGQWGFGFL